ncbi:MAG: hypothetical protein LBC87_12085 [Fibromonadaceae bacterium]|jgi:uncharacterized protein (TIGR02145 family)|nr:hypothetical protein [Fibromonadaceae bacterium]
MLTGLTKVKEALYSGKKLEQLYMDGVALFTVAPPPPQNTFTDPRDGQVYPFKTMPDNRVWMTVNLNYNQAGSYVYGYNLSNTTAQPTVGHGRLYTYSQALAAVPQGWHLPTDAEWTALALAAGGTGTYGENGVAGTRLKATSGWASNGNGTDDYGFTGLPAGYYYNNNFQRVGTDSLFWVDRSQTTYRYLQYSITTLSRNTLGSYQLSVRCIRDT